MLTSMEDKTVDTNCGSLNHTYFLEKLVIAL